MDVGDIAREASLRHAIGQYLMHYTLSEIIRAWTTDSFGPFPGHDSTD